MNIFKTQFTTIFAILASIVLYLFFAYNMERSEFWKLLSLYSGLFFSAWMLIEHSRFNFWVLAGIGVILRLLFLPAIPNLSQDFYRFLWDGRLLIQGVNPYVVTPELFFTDLPSALEVTSGKQVAQAQELYNGMGSLNASHFSNYPPVNQLCFTIAALFAGKSVAGSVIVLRVLMIIADIGILYFGKKLLEKMKLPVKNIFWYFLNPFIIIELTGNLHFEGVMLFFVVWSLFLLHKRKWLWAAILLGISVSVKLLPLLFLPLFLRYFSEKGFLTVIGIKRIILFYLVVIATVILTFAPFLSSEFIENFSATIGLWFQNFEFNASVYYIIRWVGFQVVGWNIIETAGKILPLVVIAFLAYLALFRRNNSIKQLITALLFGVSFYFLLSTTVHPWYIATPLILSVFTNYKFPIVWSFMVILSYSAYRPEGFDENLWLVALEYVVIVTFAIWEVNKKKPALLAGL